MIQLLTTLAQTSSYYNYDYSYNSSTTDSASAAAALGILLVIFAFALVVGLFFAFCMYKVFKKAGRQDAWAAFIPVYAQYVMYEVAGRPGWWALLTFIPFVGGIAYFVTSIIATIDLSKSFGKSGGFAALLILLPVVGWPMLAFGDATYKGPAGPEGNKTQMPPTPPAGTQTPAQPEV